MVSVCKLQVLLEPSMIAGDAWCHCPVSLPGLPRAAMTWFSLCVKPHVGSVPGMFPGRITSLETQAAMGSSHVLAPFGHNMVAWANPRLGWWWDTPCLPASICLLRWRTFWEGLRRSAQDESPDDTLWVWTRPRSARLTGWLS